MPKKHEHDNGHKAKHPAHAVDDAGNDERLERAIGEKQVNLAGSQGKQTRQDIHQAGGQVEGKGVQAVEDGGHDQRTDQPVGDHLVDPVRGVEPVANEFLPYHALVENGFDVPVTVIGDHGLGIHLHGLLEMLGDPLTDGKELPGHFRVVLPGLGKDLFIMLEKFQCDPAGRILIGEQVMLFDDRQHLADGLVQVRAVAEQNRLDTILGPGCFNNGAKELLQPLAAPGDNGHHRDAEQAGQPIGINFNTPALGHVDHVQGNNHGHAQLKELTAQVEVALDIGGIDNIDHHVGPFVDDEVTGHQLFHGIGAQ